MLAAAGPLLPPLPACAALRAALLLLTPVSGFTTGFSRIGTLKDDATEPVTLTFVKGVRVLHFNAPLFFANALNLQVRMLPLVLRLLFLLPLPVLLMRLQLLVLLARTTNVLQDTVAEMLAEHKATSAAAKGGEGGGAEHEDAGPGAASAVHNDPFCELPYVKIPPQQLCVLSILQLCVKFQVPDGRMFTVSRCTVGEYAKFGNSLQLGLVLDMSAVSYVDSTAVKVHT